MESKSNSGGDRDDQGKPAKHDKNVLRRVLPATALTFAMVGASAGAAQAALNTWYRVPSFNNGTASVIMEYHTVIGPGQGRAGGRVTLQTRSTDTYVQHKPIEARVGWNRTTPNRSGTYRWHDDFMLNYSGFMFRICKDQWGPDPCGPAVSVSR